MKSKLLFRIPLVIILSCFASLLHAQTGGNPKADSLQKIGDSLQKRAEYFQKTADSIRQASEKIKYWKKGCVLNIGGTQVSLSNWVAGGQNSVSLGGLFNGFINFKKNKTSWENTLNMQYGLIRQGAVKGWWKNDDQFQYTSVVGHQASKYWYYSALLDFKSQFSPGYNYPNDTTRISNILAPGYGILALGLDFKVEDYFAVLIAPATGKFTLVNDAALADAGAFGVTKAVVDANGNVLTHGKKFRAEIGSYVKIKFKKEVVKNVTIETNVELFSNYLVKPQNIDVMWTTLTTLKINKYLSTTLSTHLIYDNDVQVPVDRNGDGIKESTGPRLQFKQVLSLALAIKLGK